MRSKRDESLTAVKVRGKRQAASSEKWRIDRSRKPELQKRHMPTGASTSEHASFRSRKHKQKMIEDESPLERLPVEVLQQVFQYSINIELPMVSRELASKLSKSGHLQHQLTSQLLESVLGNASASSQELRNATRLLNSRFMTWDFFTKWLRSVTSSMEHSETQECNWSVNRVKGAWLALRPSPALLPPKKLLSSPFNQEKAQLLAVLSYNIQNLASMDAVHGELGYEGLVEAIRQDRHDVIRLLLGMGIGVSTESLRVAVTEAGCNEEIVRMLIDCDGDEVNGSDSHASAVCNADAFVDLLDPTIWTWADEAQKAGNHKGKWLVEFLKDAQQRKRRTNHETHCSIQNPGNAQSQWHHP